MKKLLVILCIVYFAALGFDGSSAKAASESELAQLIKQQINIKNQVHEIAKIARKLGFKETHPIIVNAQKEWSAAHKKQAQYQSELKSWKQKEKEYPNAAYIWNYLKAQGFNDYVCAGIMGNLMAETGGQTLNINPYVYANGYYGMCMWSLYYCPHVSGMSLKSQCDYLKKSMVTEFNNFGFCYYSGFNYNKFCNMMSAREAATAFAACYERCSSSTYYIRQVNADKAYKYFVG